MYEAMYQALQLLILVHSLALGAVSQTTFLVDGVVPVAYRFCKLL